MSGLEGGGLTGGGVGGSYQPGVYVPLKALFLVNIHVIHLGDLLFEIGRMIKQRRKFLISNRETGNLK